ncbi:MAG: AAA family ATPase [Clostridia bacterium]|nr:AAA family ATPase [Clostridia bacterium]
MAKRLLIITGYPGSGKSFISAMIVRAFPSFSTFAYDDVKEEWFDRLGFDGMEEKSRVNDRSLMDYWQRLGERMEAGGDLLIEYPFCRKHVAALKALIDRYGYMPYTVVLAGDPAVLWQRFARRDAVSDRHPGHICSTYHRDGERIIAPRLSLEEYTRDCAEKDYFINLGPSITLDMSDLSRVDHQGLLAFLHARLDG